MRYVFNRRWLSLRTDFAISDETGAARYKVVSAMISLSERLTLRRGDGAVAATITRKLISWRPRYEIARPEGPGAAVIPQGWVWRSYLIDADGARYRVTGGFWRRRYLFKREGRRAAAARLPYLSMTRRCWIDIEAGEDVELLLAAWVAILKLRDGENPKGAAAKDGEAA